MSSAKGIFKFFNLYSVSKIVVQLEQDMKFKKVVQGVLKKTVDAGSHGAQ
jgi:ribosomal protein S3